MRPFDPAGVPLNGVHLVEAAAGTGKTYSLTALHLRLVLEAGLGLPEILVVTFTNAATAELRERIRQRMVAAVRWLEGGGAPGDPFLADYLPTRRDPAGDRARLLAEIRRMDEAAIYTIHGFCQRVLGDHAFESGLAFEWSFLGDVGPLAEELERDFLAGRIAALPPELYGPLRASGFRHSGDSRGEEPPLLAILREALADPDRPFVPAGTADEEAVRLALRQADAARAEARRIWEADKPQVLALIGSAAMDKRSWNKGVTDKRVRQLEAALALPDGVLADPKQIQCFSREDIAAKTKAGQTPPAHPFFDQVTAWVSAIAAVGQRAAEWRVTLLGEMVAWARAEAQARKEARGLITYDDLLHRLDAALAGPRGEALASAVRQRYGAALVDEFQDTDPVQYRIFWRLFSRPPVSLFLVGDPKQAIYGFRGADVYAYLEAARRPEVTRHTLRTNYRSAAGVLAGVNAVFSRAEAPFVETEIPFVPAAPGPGAADMGLLGPPEWTAPWDALVLVPPPGPEAQKKAAKVPSPTDVGREIPDRIAWDIAGLLGAGVRLRSAAGATRPLVPGDIAVLVRTGTEARDVLAALGRAGVPATLQQDLSVFTTSEAEVLEALFLALAAPEDGRRLRGALATPLFGLDARDLASVADDEVEGERWARRFLSWAERWERLGALPTVRQILETQRVAARWLAWPDGERRLTDLRHLVELCHLAAAEQRLDPGGLARWLADRRARAAARQEPDGEAAQIRLDRDTAAVQVLTMHKAKGLEFPVVYCASLWRDAKPPKGVVPRFHDPEDGGRAKSALVAVQDAGVAQRVAREALAEELRLAYVALTRAQYRCTLVWPWCQKLGKSVLGYLLHRPPGAAAGESPTAAAEARLEALGPEGLREDIDALAAAVAAEGGRMTVREPPSEPIRLPRGGLPGTEPDRRLTARPLPPPRRRARSIESFSSLERRARAGEDAAWGPGPAAALGGEEALPPEAAEGRDRDAETFAEGPPEVRVPGAEGDAEAAASGGVLSGFPPGARVGLLVHGLLERLPFDAPADAVAEAATRQVYRFGLDGGRLGPVLARAALGWLETPLGLSGASADAGVAAPKPGWSLRSVPAGDQARELGFTLTLRPAAGDLQRALAAALRVDAAPGSAVARYAETLAAAAPIPGLDGWLRGFVDLVVRRPASGGERWFVIDYKTNDLGPDPARDYGPERVEAAMAATHYVLQYHLYAVALCRHLGARRPGIDLEAAFGGCAYLFLRGLGPDLPAGTGVYFDRPPIGRLEALSEVLSGVGLAGPPAGRGA